MSSYLFVTIGSSNQVPRNEARVDIEGGLTTPCALIFFFPSRSAPINFSLMPPTGSTLPRRLNSPVMARVGGTGLPLNKLTSAMCTWILRFFMMSSAGSCVKANSLSTSPSLPILHSYCWAVGGSGACIRGFGIRYSLAATDRANLTLKVAHTGFPSVRSDDLVKNVFSNRDLVVIKAIGGDLLWYQVTIGNVSLLDGSVTRVGNSDLLKATDNQTRHCCNVCPAMSTDLGFISAVATDLAKLVFPTPGGPTRSKIGDLSTIRFLLKILISSGVCSGFFIGLFIDLVNLRLEVGVHLLLELEVELIFGKSCPRNLGKILKLSFGDFGGLWRQLSIVDTLFQLINLVGFFFIVSRSTARSRRSLSGRAEMIRSLSSWEHSMMFVIKSARTPASCRSFLTMKSSRRRARSGDRVFAGELLEFGEESLNLLVGLIDMFIGMDVDFSFKLIFGSVGRVDGGNGASFRVVTIIEKLLTIGAEIRRVYRKTSNSDRGVIGGWSGSFAVDVCEDGGNIATTLQRNAEREAWQENGSLCQRDDRKGSHVGRSYGRVAAS
ncbi:hypothetical protein KCU93_g330, partial [Aureobasidium melanogenum]